MANYLEAAREVLAAMSGGGARRPKIGGPESIVAPVPEWPQSLSELAAEVGQRSGDPEAARCEVWMDWCEWQARRLNRLFQEQGVTGKPGRITAATVRHGELKRAGKTNPQHEGP